MNTRQNLKQEQKNAAQSRKEIFMGCFALATVFGCAGVVAVPIHEPTAMVLIGLCSLSLAGGCLTGTVEMGIEGARHFRLKSAFKARKAARGRGRD